MINLQAINKIFANTSQKSMKPSEISHEIFDGGYPDTLHFTMIILPLLDQLRLILGLAVQIITIEAVSQFLIIFLNTYHQQMKRFLSFNIKIVRTQSIIPTIIVIWVLYLQNGQIVIFV